MKLSIVLPAGAGGTEAVAKQARALLRRSRIQGEVLVQGISGALGDFILVLPLGLAPSASDLKRMLVRGRSVDCVLGVSSGAPAPSGTARFLLRSLLGLAVGDPQAPFLVRRKSLSGSRAAVFLDSPFPGLSVLYHFLKQGLRAEELPLKTGLTGEAKPRAGLAALALELLRLRLGLGAPPGWDALKRALLSQWLPAMAVAVLGWKGADQLDKGGRATLALALRGLSILAAFVLSGGRAASGLDRVRPGPGTANWGKVGLSLAVGGLGFVLVRPAWIGHSQLALTLVLIFGCAVVLGFINRETGDSGSRSTARGPAHPAAGEESPGIFPSLLVLGAGGLAVAGSQAWLKTKIPDALLDFAGALVLFHLSRPRASSAPRKFAPPVWAEALLLALLLAGGAALRFHRLGEVPRGMYSDEVLILEESMNIAHGDRPTFMAKSEWSQGAVPVYLSAFCYKFFGEDLRAFRMTAALGGMALVMAVYLVGRGLFGAWAALGAAAFAALELWPVAFSRIHYMEQISALFMTLALGGIVWGLKRRNYYALALGGVIGGLCLNTYLAGRGILVLIPLFAALIALAGGPAAKDSTRPGLVFLLGGVLGAAPLLHWFLSPPVYGGDLSNFDRYGMSWRLQHITPGVLTENISLMQKLDAYARMAQHEAPKLLTMFVSRGPEQMFHMLQTTPVISHLGLILAAAGCLACLSRFRSAAWAYLPLWLVVALIPGVVTHSVPDARRTIMALPALALMAGTGFSLMLEAAGSCFRRPGVRNGLGALALGILALGLGQSTAHRYFFVINESPAYLDFNRANSSAWARAVSAERAKGPFFHVSYKRPIQESLMAPFVESYDRVIGILNPDVPIRWMHDNPDGFQNGSLLGRLKAETEAQAGARTALISLSPFYFYLEPYLSKNLGGGQVQDVKVVRSPLGICKRGLEVLPTEDSLVHLWRLPALDPQKLEALKGETSLPLILENLEPPAALGSVETVQKTSYFSPATASLLNAYRKQRASWRVADHFEIRLPDPYFWTLGSAIHGALRPPFRLRVRWNLQVPAAGSYVFGANVSFPTAVRVDGKEVLWANVATQDDLIKAQTGFFGAPLQLSAGSHVLEAEQIVLNLTDILMHEFRLLWKTPGGAEETLPLALLRPAP